MLGSALDLVLSRSSAAPVGVTAGARSVPAHVEKARHRVGGGPRSGRYSVRRVAHDQLQLVTSVETAPPASETEPVRSVRIGDRVLEPTEVFDTYWRFAAA